MGSSFMKEITKIQSAQGGWMGVCIYIKYMHNLPKVSSKGFGPVIIDKLSDFDGRMR